MMRVKMKDLPPAVQSLVKAQIAAEDRNRHGRIKVPTDRPGMNKTEGQYANHLDLLVRSGEVQGWAFEADTFELGHRCTYTPDFRVSFPDGRIEYHEVKGFWRDDARVKIKVAARKNSEFRFVAVKLRGRRWEYEHIKP